MRIATVKEWLASATEIFLPRKCRLCGCLLGRNEQHICRACLASLSRTGYAVMELNPMEQRFSGVRGTLVKAVSPFFYDKKAGVSQLVHALKYGRVKSLGVWFGRLVAQEIAPYGWFEDADLLVPVPLHPLKRWSRGFNQSLELARGISEYTGIPVLDCLRMRRWQSPQARRGRDDRWRRRRGVYAVDPRLKKAIEGKHLVVVDDVCTTGSTLQEIIRVLAGVGGVKVSLLTATVAHD